MLQNTESSSNTNSLQNNEVPDGAKEVIRLSRENLLKTWHGATGWVVSASIAGGVCQIHISFANKKMVWSGVLAGISLEGQISAMTGVIYMEPEQLMKHKFITISSSKLLAGFTKIEFWLSEGGVGFAGNLTGVGVGLGASHSMGYGKWAYE